MQTNQEIYELILTEAQEKGFQSAFCYYIAKDDKGNFTLNTGYKLQIGDMFIQENIREMDIISSQEKFLFWVKSTEGQAFLNQKNN